MNNRISEKEKNIKQMLETIRTTLNNGRLEYNKNPNQWGYIAMLGQTEIKLKSLVEELLQQTKDI